MNHEFRFRICAPSLISAMMQAMAQNEIMESDSELRTRALNTIEEVSYKWVNKP